jgi:hypothetical protein
MTALGAREAALRRNTFRRRHAPRRGTLQCRVPTAGENVARGESMVQRSLHVAKRQPIEHVTLS